MLTKEEQAVLRHYIIISIARKALEKDLFLLEKTPLKLQGTYLELVRKTLEQISKEMALIKRYMKLHQMKIEKQESDGFFSTYAYWCRGYEGVNRILNTHLKQQVTNYLMRFFTFEKSRLSQLDG